MSSIASNTKSTSLYLINKICLLIALFVSTEPQVLGLCLEGHTSRHIERTRKEPSALFQEHGPIYTTRAYWMSQESFWKASLFAVEASWRQA